jgi:hypothetical protein
MHYASILCLVPCAARAARAAPCSLTHSHPLPALQAFTSIGEGPETALGRAITETALCTALNHPNIVATYHYEIKKMVTQQCDEGLNVVVADRTKADDTCSSVPTDYKLFIIQVVDVGGDAPRRAV